MCQYINDKSANYAKQIYKNYIDGFVIIRSERGSEVVMINLN